MGRGVIMALFGGVRISEVSINSTPDTINLHFSDRPRPNAGLTSECYNEPIGKPIEVSRM